MADRQINCESCSTNLGVIRDAKLRNDISYFCTPCKNKAAKKIAELESTINLLRVTTKHRKEESPFEDLFGDIFGGRK